MEIAVRGPAALCHDRRHHIPEILQLGFAVTLSLEPGRSLFIANIPGIIQVFEVRIAVLQTLTFSGADLDERAVRKLECRTRFGKNLHAGGRRDIGGVLGHHHQAKLLGAAHTGLLREIADRARLALDLRGESKAPSRCRRSCTLHFPTGARR